MNTSAKGSAYENAFKRELYRRGAQVVMRAAASKGPFDLIAIFPDNVIAYQLKDSKTVTCNGAQKQLLKLPWAWNCLPSFVHRTKAREFCEH